LQCTPCSTVVGSSCRYCHYFGLYRMHCLGHYFLHISFSSGTFLKFMQVGSHYHYAIMVFSNFLQHKVHKLVKQLNDVCHISTYHSRVSGSYTYFGVKWLILPSCLKGKLYASHAFVHRGRILHQGCHCVQNDSTLCH